MFLTTANTSTSNDMHGRRWIHFCIERYVNGQCSFNIYS